MTFAVSCVLSVLLLQAGQAIRLQPAYSARARLRPTANASNTENNWELIISQMDAASNLFSAGSKTTFTQNQNDLSANPFMKVGAMNWANYAGSDGKFHFRIQFTGGQTVSHTIEWKQTSFLSKGTIAGFELVDGDVGSGFSIFTGLGASSSAKCVIDGNGSGPSWWNCAAAVGCYKQCIPGSNMRVAESVQVWVKARGPTANPTKSTGGPTATPTTSAPTSVTPTATPTTSAPTSVTPTATTATPTTSAPTSVTATPTTATPTTGPTTGPNTAVPTAWAIHMTDHHVRIAWVDLKQDVGVQGHQDHAWTVDKH